MYRRSTVALLPLMVAVWISFAHADLPCGAWGYVYDHNEDLAGSDFVTMHIYRLDDTGTSGYYYNQFGSYYNVGCGQGLVTGDWFIYAETNEGGTHYYSDGYAFYDWYPHLSLERHDLHCTKTYAPQIPPGSR